MAIYYVRPDGNNTNAGTGPAANQAWQTLARIVQAGTAFTSGDTVYIAPGTYRQSITTTATYTSATNFFGDPTAAQFPAVTPGMVRITNFLSNDNSAATNQLLWGGVTFDYINISNIYFDHSTFNGGIFYSGTGNNSTIRNCVFSGNSGAGGGVGTPPIRLTSIKNVTIENCIFMRSHVGIYLTTTTDTNTNVNIRNCFAINLGGNGLWIANSTGGGVKISNNVVCDAVGTGIVISGAGNATSICYITNNIFYGCQNGVISGGSATNIVEDFNRRVNSGGNSVVPVGVNTVTDGAPQFDFGHSALFNIALQKPFSSITGSVNVGAGLSTYASTTDLYGQTWSAGASLPDIGCATAVQASGTSYYYPTERNAGTITIAPGSTSQSIELYLGATGLTASTSGLSASFNRTRSVATPITLVAVSLITDGWVSGGFKEVNASTMPGVYRLDLPDAAVVAGADDVTVVVRGVSGTNGAVMTIKLSSGGLTAAQTAQAVLDAVASTHNNIGSIGASIQDKAGYSLSTPQSFSTTGSVGSVTGNVAGNVTGTVGGVVGNVTGNIAGSVATVASPDNIIDGVWDEQRVGHTASGSFGEKLQTNALADEMLARDLGSGLNAGAAEERTVRSALRAIRNKVNVGSSQMVVKKEDDTTDAWTASVTTTAVSSNVSGIDPN